MLEDKGYDTFMVFVHTDLDIAQKRNMSRPRKLNPEIVEKYWNDVQHNKATFQGLFGNVNFLLVDNSKVLDEKQAKKKFDMLVKKGIDKFVNRPVKNHLGKKWIEKQKQLGVAIPFLVLIPTIILLISTTIILLVFFTELIMHSLSRGLRVLISTSSTLTPFFMKCFAHFNDSIIIYE